MAFTIASSVGASMSAATGYSSQGHLQYAVNQGAYWCFYLTSTQTLSAAYSTNAGASWSTPQTFSLADTHGSEGRNFGFFYKSISGVDVLHMSRYANTGLYNAASRFTLGTTWTNTNAETDYFYNGGAEVRGTVPWLDSSNIRYDQTMTSGGADRAELFLVAGGSTADSGASWTQGTASGTTVYGADAYPTWHAFAQSGSNVIALCDDGEYVGGGISYGHKNVRAAVWNGSSWGTSVGVWPSNNTGADNANLASVQVSGSDLHVFALTDNSSTIQQYRYNGSSWSAGDTIGALALNTSPSGLSAVTDGTAIWLGGIDSGKNIQYNKWTSGTGWGGWTVLEATRTNTPSYITGCYNPTAQAIMWAWTEHNGSNYDIIGSTLSTAAGVTYSLFRPATLSLGAGGPFFQTPVNA